MIYLQRILHPTDLSEYSEQAFQAACVLARDCHAHLIVLHVAPLPVGVTAGFAPVPPPDPSWETLESRLHQIKPSFPEVSFEHRLAEGDAVPTILDVARETQADLIVMGTHGRTGLKRLFSGSVAEEIVRKGPCSVLVVKVPEPETVTPSHSLFEEGEAPAVPTRVPPLS